MGSPAQEEQHHAWRIECVLSSISDYPSIVAALSTSPLSYLTPYILSGRAGGSLGALLLSPWPGRLSRDPASRLF